MCKISHASPEKEKDFLLLISHLLHQSILSDKVKQHQKSVRDLRFRWKWLNRDKWAERHSRQQQVDKVRGMDATDALSRLKLRRKDFIWVVQRHDPTFQLCWQTESSLFRQSFRWWFLIIADSYILEFNI